jgi:hypothetical protein
MLEGFAQHQGVTFFFVKQEIAARPTRKKATIQAFGSDGYLTAGPKDDDDCVFGFGPVVAIATVVDDGYHDDTTKYNRQNSCKIDNTKKKALSSPNRLINSERV